MIHDNLQWGGRFASAPDAALLAFGSSLETDLALAPFDVRCSLAHVAALESGGIVDAATARALRSALTAVASEIEAGTFAAYARESGAEDIHGAIDLRVRDLAGAPGETLHTGRSRNDQVATTLRLFVAHSCSRGQAALVQAVSVLTERAAQALNDGAVLPAMTHWQPAQPALLAFWLGAAASPLVRAADRCGAAAAEAMLEMPLGSGAVCGSSLPLDREASRAQLGFVHAARNAMDAIGSRDVALDCAHSLVTAIAAAARIASELVVWCNPLAGFATLADAASTGSSLMPQKRNPDPLELIRGIAPSLAGAYAGALAGTCGLALSYHRDLQQTKAAVVAICAQAVAALEAFARTLSYVGFNYEAMQRAAGRGFTVATDIADMLVASGVPARSAHHAVGKAVAKAESEHRELQPEDVDTIAKQFGLADFRAPLTPMESVCSKKTAGSTAPDEVAAQLRLLRAWLDERQAV